MKCERCGVDLVVGMALENKIHYSSDQFGGTCYPTTEARTIECLKCSKCGHSEKPIYGEGYADKDRSR